MGWLAALIAAAAAAGAVGTALAQPIVSLIVAKNTTGGGIVTGAGISCGAQCRQVVAAGATIRLVAAPANGATFVRWVGCTSASGTTCTVVMNQNVTVTAIFSTPGPTLLVPAASPTDTYVIEFACSSDLCSNIFTIEEAADLSFSSPTRYTYDGRSPGSYAFRNKRDGTYCYRVASGFGGPWSAAACVVVSSTGTLRIVNETSRPAGRPRPARPTVPRAVSKPDPGR